MSTAEGRPTTTVLASAETPTAPHERQQLIYFTEIGLKVVRMAKKFVNNYEKSVKNPI